MRTTMIQSNLTVGELSPDMWARVDNDMYYSGVAKAQNCVIMPHGGLRRRPGLTATADSLLSGDGKIFAFEFSTVQDYIIHLAPNEFSVYKDGELQTTVTTDVPYSTIDEVKEVDVIQSGDVMVVTHQDYAPRLIQRQGTHVDWNIVIAPLVNVPQYDFGSGDEDVWSDNRGWPAVCTFYQARLWFAGSTQKPNSVWGSKINSFFDFDGGTGQADYALFDTLDTEQYNQITNIYTGRSLMVFTTGSEFYQTSDIVTPETSAWKRSTGYGSKRIRPTMVDGAVLFTDRIGRTVRSAVYAFEEDAFVAPSISVPSEHLIRDVVSIDSVKGTNIDVSDFVYIINSDGTMAVLNTLRQHGTEGWTQWTTDSGNMDGGFIDVVAVNNIVYFMCKREGEYHLEYMNEGTTTDHNSFLYSNTAVTEIDTEQSVAMASLTYKLILDNSVMEDTIGGVVPFPREAYSAEIGLDVPLNVTSMPISIQAQDGVTRNDRTRVIKAMLNMRESLGVYANTIYAPDRRFTVVLDEAPVPYTGLKEVFLLGYTRENQLVITQDNPLPFKILGLGFEIEIGDN